MSRLIYHTDERRLLPKIKNSKDYNEKRILKSISLNNIEDKRLLVSFKDDKIKDKIEIWKNQKSIELAGEILSQSIVYNSKENIDEIINYLKINNNDSIINDYMLNEKSFDSIKIQDDISNNKKRLISEPKDSITWVNQAINYFNLGQVEQSKKCIVSALAINKDISFVTRNASRLFSYFGDNGRSINILKKSKFYKFDPQIISAEIAFSQVENRKTKGYEFGKKLLNDKRYSNYQLSELAGVFGTREYFDGNYKKSEDFFDNSLIDPSENSLAQSLWYKQNPIANSTLNLYENSNEILTHRESKDSNFPKSLIYAKKWIDDEKYSIRPYRTAADLNGMLGNYSQAFDIIEKGMSFQKMIKGKLTEDEKIGLINDLVYYSLKNNDLIKANTLILPILEKISKSKRKQTDLENINLATLGLFSYKNKDYKTGKKFYKQAIEYFRNKDDFYNQQSAFINFFNEEIEVLNSFENLEKLKKEFDKIVTDKSENDLVFLKKKSILKFNERIDYLNNN